MNLFRQFFGSKSNAFNNGPPSMPWDRRPSAYEFVRSHIVENEPGLIDGAETLPDDERFLKGSKAHWKAGAQDGILTHHARRPHNERTVRKLVDLLAKYSAQPTFRNKELVYQQVLAERVVSIVDPLIEAITAESRINFTRLYELAYSFATESQDREPVKFGISLLGLFDQPANLELFMTLGRHEEFTLFCAVAIANLCGEDDSLLWSLARQVGGWGRIHVVECLATTHNSSIKDWLLREGFRNSEQYEYLASICASTGGLLNALSRDHVDRELLTSAGEIIQALIVGGPAAGIDDYADGPAAIHKFIHLMISSAATITDFVQITSIEAFLREDDSRWEARMKLGWTAELRSSLEALCHTLLERSEWQKIACAAFTNPREMSDSFVTQSGAVFENDTWDYHWDRLQQSPNNIECWNHVLNLCDHFRMNLVITFAEKQCEWAQYSSWGEQSNQSRRGPSSHSCLDRLLQELCRFPSFGVTLIATGLKSPCPKNRQTAVTVLASWPRGQWPSGLYDSLKMAAIFETDDRLRNRIRKVLEGRPHGP